MAAQQLKAGSRYHVRLAGKKSSGHILVTEVKGNEVSFATEAGLPRIRLHDLRHSFASMVRDAGVELEVLSRRLGHASMTITADLYVHTKRSRDREAAETVASAIFGG